MLAFFLGFVFGVAAQYWLSMEAHGEMSRVEHEAEDAAATAWDQN